MLLETFQRCRHAYRNKSLEPLYYGFKENKRIIWVDEKQDLFRQPFTILEKEKGKNLLFIGGSSTYCVDNDDLHTFPYLLQAKINGISSLNSGRPGVISDQYLDILKRCIKEFCVPDMVIFYTGGNDIFWKNSLWRNKMINKFAKYSFLTLTIMEKFIMLDLEKRKDFEYRKRFIKEFEENMEDCIEFAQSKNIIVVLIPEVLVTEDLGPLGDFRWHRELYLEMPGVIERLAQKHNCFFLNPKDLLYADWRENFKGTVHFTDKGSEAFSTFLAHNLPLEKK